MKSGKNGGAGASLDGSGEAESLNKWWQDPADEIDPSTLPESGIVFADSEFPCGHERVTES